MVEVDTYDCHKWIAVGDIVLDFPLKDYDQYFFNDLYIVGSSGNDDGVFCVYRPRRNGVGEWSRADLIGYIYNYRELLNFINLRAPFINLKTDEKIKVNGETKQKVFIFFPFSFTRGNGSNMSLFETPRPQIWCHRLCSFLN